MQGFYGYCFTCVQGSCERCFECAKAKAIREGWVHSLGFYFSRRKEEHKTSVWSQAIIMLKGNNRHIVSVFGRIVACYMEKHLKEIKPYHITSVPVFNGSQFLFQGFQIPPMQFLVHSAFVNLKDTRWISYGVVLVQARQKSRKQQSCITDSQRMKNVKGIYAVQNPESIKAKNIVLLDDIVTSGATMNECSRALLEAGARSVIGVTLAKTFRKGAINGNQD